MTAAKWCDVNWRSFLTGEALVGDGNEVAHIDLLVGDKRGNAGLIFGKTLFGTTAGHPSLLGIVNVNMQAKPDCISATKVTIKGAADSVRMFGPGQAALGNAVNDAMLDGDFNLIADEPRETLCVVAGIFIHWNAKDDMKILRYNYEAIRTAIRRAARHEPGLSDLDQAKKDSLRHVFTGVEQADFTGCLTDLREKFAKAS